jgi:hypothetical protein
MRAVERDDSRLLQSNDSYTSVRSSPETKSCVVTERGLNGRDLGRIFVVDVHPRLAQERGIGRVEEVELHLDLRERGQLAREPVVLRALPLSRAGGPAT